MGIYALGVLPFLAAAMMIGTRKFKNKADDLLETGTPGKAGTAQEQVVLEK
jgi:hypothetical protein